MTFIKLIIVVPATIISSTSKASFTTKRGVALSHKNVDCAIAQLSCLSRIVDTLSVSTLVNVALLNQTITVSP